MGGEVLTCTDSHVDVCSNCALFTPGGGGCFGFLTWENDASYEATIWDAKNKTVAGKVSSDAAGTSYMPALILPIPLVARVQSNACFGLADQLDTFFTN